MMYHGVTLGSKNLVNTKRHPTIEDRVVLGTGSKILGDIIIGHDSIVGANSVVSKSLPPHSIVGGIPDNHLNNRLNTKMDFSIFF